MKEAILRLSLQGWLFAHAPAGWSGRMSPAYYRASAERILPPSYRCSSDGRSPSPAESGARPDSSPPHPDASTWAGECLTLNIPEFNNFRGRSRSEGSVSSLSEVLVRGPIAKRYFLTERCAAGIYRRAEKRGKVLPPVLKAALDLMLGCAGGTEARRRTPSPPAPSGS